MRKITKELIQKLKGYLIDEEKSAATLDKYIRDITVFMQWSNDKELCKSLVLEGKQELKEKYPHIKRIYVRSSYQHIPDWYEESLLKNNEGTYFPEHMENAGRASYVERNQEMINKSDFCIVY